MTEAIQPPINLLEEPGRRYPATMSPTPGSGEAASPVPSAPTRHWPVVAILGVVVVTLFAVVSQRELFDLVGTAALFAALFLGPVMAIASMVRHRRDERALAEIELLWCETSEALGQQRALLRRIVDAQPTGISIIDAEGRCRFANKTAARRAGHEPAEMLGQVIEALWPGEQAAAVRTANLAALESGLPQQQRIEVELDDQKRVLLTDHVPLAAAAGLPLGVLVIERDVSLRVAERKRHAETREAVVEALTGTVDQRDPYAAHHALRAGALAEQLAEDMGDEPAVRRTARNAGNLLTLGKMLVPEVMLTHQAGLSPAECRQAHVSLESSIDLLHGLDLDGPVADTLRQLEERVDGRGMPLGLAGTEILPSARILKVANSFLGLMGRHPGSPGMSVDEALAELRRYAGVLYDPEVIEALACHLDEGGRTTWQPIDRPETPDPFGN